MYNIKEMSTLNTLNIIQKLFGHKKFPAQDLSIYTGLDDYKCLKSQIPPCLPLLASLCKLANSGANDIGSGFTRPA